MKLAGKVAVVAGAGHRVSDAIARRLVDEGACVVLGGKEPNALLRTCGELYGWPPKPHTLVVMEPDDAQSAEDLVQVALQAFGRIDIAVDAWKCTVSGAPYLARAAGCAMAAQGSGRIVAVSVRDDIVRHTRDLARDLGPHGVAVNCVASSGTAAEVAEATLFFAVDGARLVTGQTVRLGSGQGSTSEPADSEASQAVSVA